MSNQHLLITNLPPEVILQIIYSIDELLAVLKLQQTCKYIFYLINNNRQYITATHIISLRNLQVSKYSPVDDTLKEITGYRVLNINKCGTFTINNKKNSYTIKGAIEANEIIYCEKQYYRYHIPTWSIWFSQTTPIRLIYVYMHINGTVSYNDFLYSNNYPDFSYSYNVLNDIINCKKIFSDAITNNGIVNKNKKYVGGYSPLEFFMSRIYN